MDEINFDTLGDLDFCGDPVTIAWRRVLSQRKGITNNRKYCFYVITHKEDVHFFFRKEEFEMYRCKHGDQYCQMFRVFEKALILYLKSIRNQDLVAAGEKVINQYHEIIIQDKAIDDKLQMW